MPDSSENTEPYLYYLCIVWYKVWKAHESGDPFYWNYWSWQRRRAIKSEDRKREWETIARYMLKWAIWFTKWPIQYNSRDDVYIYVRSRRGISNRAKMASKISRSQDFIEISGKSNQIKISHRFQDLTEISQDLTKNSQDLTQFITNPLEEDYCAAKLGSA